MFPASQGALEAHRILGDDKSAGKSANPGVPQRETASQLPTVYSLSENYPNPFNPSTTMRYGLPEASTVELIVYDVLGREVAVLARGYTEAGYHTASWGSPNLASGVYFARLIASDQWGQRRYTKVNKLLLTK
jgi:hypothetical protein